MMQCAVCKREFPEGELIGIGVVESGFDTGDQYFDVEDCKCPHCEAPYRRTTRYNMVPDTYTTEFLGKKRADIVPGIVMDRDIVIGVDFEEGWFVTDDTRLIFLRISETSTIEQSRKDLGDAAIDKLIADGWTGFLDYTILEADRVNYDTGIFLYKNGQHINSVLDNAGKDIRVIGRLHVRNPYWLLIEVYSGDTAEVCNILIAALSNDLLARSRDQEE